MVACHHVVFNVGDIVPFIRALANHAQRRVVIELPETHPTAPFNHLWQRFWQLDRPTQPTASDFVNVFREDGIAPTIEPFERAPRKAAAAELTDEYISFVRKRLCLPATRDHEVAAALSESGPLQSVGVAAVWWDV